MLYPVQLDEKAVRRETFVPGVAITLWDGQAWHFPRPMVRWRRSLRDDIETVEARTSLGPAFDAATRAVRDRDDSADATSLMFDLAASMLAANYDLTREDLYGLLAHDPLDADNEDSWLEIMAVATGSAPRTLGRWLHLAPWMSSGPPSDWVCLEDLNDHIAMLVQMGRAVPANKWVQELIDDEEARTNDAAGPA